ncbi:MAG: LPS assembly lipoprotein LptE [Planctomycetota bacterium]|nr:LPS assembly lipoprotein LptE [Planctomycetota bacterium]
MAAVALIRSVLILVLLLGAACSGYSTQRLEDFPRARTIAVVPFTNTGFRRDLELRLSQAVATELRARTSYAQTTPQSADLLLTGSMAAEETPIVLDDEGRVVQKRLEGWIDVRVVERASGRVLREGRVRALEEVRPGTGGESVEGSASDEWVRQLAERVVQLLERPF